MVKYGPHRRVDYRREREGKTDYRNRIRLLRSDKPRLVVRISLQHIRSQVATPSSDGDEILASAFSKELSEWGWKGHTTNTPSAYLVGLLCGYKALEEDIKECVLDIDRFVPSSQAKIFSVMKGALDAGLEIPHGEDSLPTEERISGQHISEYAGMLKSEDEEKYQSQFSNYIEKDLLPEDLPEHFKEVKESIESQYGG